MQIDFDTVMEITKNMELLNRKDKKFPWNGYNLQRILKDYNLEEQLYESDTIKKLTNKITDVNQLTKIFETQQGRVDWKCWDLYDGCSGYLDLKSIGRSTTTFIKSI